MVCDKQITQVIVREIIEQSRYKPIVPFIGSGISVASGYPSIGYVIHYLAKVIFAIEFGVYKNRFPQLDEESKKQLEENYKQHPSRYIRDFGWPNIGNLDADLWNWVSENKNETNFKTLFIKLTKDDAKGKPEVEYGVEDRDLLLGIVQWVLRREQGFRDAGTSKGIKDEWLKWKRWRATDSNEDPDSKPQLLYGDWEQLLDKICEGDYGLVDQMFNGFEQGLYPAQAHRLLVFLQAKLGIPLMMTTNFDTFLERAFIEEGINPKVFDIHRDAELPDYGLVNHRFSILKLHGSAYGLRLGERLRLKLETDARQNAIKYLPQNALIIVIGFSGSERRMMQLLNAFLESENEETLKIVWIQGPSKPGPLLKELIEQNKNKIKWCQIKHADTFLQELYFHISYSHQSALNPYSSLPGPNFLTTLDLKLPKPTSKETNYKKIDPIQIFYDDQSELNTSKSWATLAGSAFIQSLASEGYRIIWIDIENHRTLESVLAEIFSRIQLVDSLAPGFKISIPSKSSEKDIDKNISKAAGRIFNILKRGKYVLALDSIDSFGRQPLGHHGLPNYPKHSDLDNAFKTQTERLESLILKIIEDCNKIYDSYIVITIEKPSIRHPNSNQKDCENLTSKVTRDSIHHILQNADKQKNISIFKNPGISTDDFEPNKFYCDYENFQQNFKNIPKDKLTNNFSPFWCRENKIIAQEIHLNNALIRSNDVYDLFEFIKAKNDEETNTILDKNYSGILTAFVCWLSIFRRPRTLPILRGMVNQWMVGENFVSEKDEKRYHQNFQSLLTLILPTNSHGEINSEEDQHAIRDAAQKHNDKEIKIAAQKLEGGSIWLFREAHETFYEALTENLHFQKWVDAWNKDAHPEHLSLEAAIIDGLIVINWHLQAAINYHVNVYLPTNDVQAFYEYFYHRISALRSITLLIEIISRVKIDDWNNVEKKIINLHNNQKLHLKWLDQNQLSTNESVFFCFANKINAINDSSNKDESNKYETKRDNFLDILVKQRCSIFKKTFMALKRNQDYLVAYSGPEIVWSWTRHIIERDLPEIIFDKNNSAANKSSSTDFNSKLDDKFINPAFENRANNFNILLKTIEFKALYAKLDFQNTDENNQSMSFEEQVFDIRCLLQQNNNKAIIQIEALIDQDKERKKIDDKTYKKFTEKDLRDLHAIAAKSLLAKYSIWSYFNRRSSLRENIILTKATKYVQKYEIFLRKTCESKHEELIHRTEYFALKARILYLSEQFQKAHGYLDLAAANHQPKEIEHIVNAGMVHILRAELLAMSADIHYKTCLEQFEDELDLKQEVGASLKKLERAEQELLNAKNIFGSMSHQKLWQVYMELGFAQLKLERLLFELDEFYSNWRKLSNDEYIRLSGLFEQKILDAFGCLRSIFDLLPFNSSTWNDSCKSENVFDNELPSLIKIEIMCYALWNSLFYVGVIYSSMLALSKQSKNAKQKPLVYQILSYAIYNQFSTYASCWKEWNSAMRFHKMHDFPLIFQLRNEMIFDENELKEKRTPEFNSLSEISVREVTLLIIEYQISKTSIGAIWNKRRE